MNDSIRFMVQNENGVRNVAYLLSTLNIEGIDYAIYRVDDDNESSVFVGQIIKNENGKNIIVSIDDENKKKMIFQMVDRVIKES